MFQKIELYQCQSVLLSCGSLIIPFYIHVCMYICMLKFHFVFVFMLCVVFVAFAYRL